MTWFLNARNAMILVLSWATATAPLQARAMTPQKFDMYKKAIESSGLAGAKPVKLKDFYRQHQAKFPRQMQFEIENFLRANPNADAPKLTVTKVKNKKGTDDIRVLINFNGANQTVTIVDDSTNFMQVGSATLKYSDFYNPTKLFAKVEKAIDIKPDSWRSLPKSMTTPFRMATFEQMQKMNLATRTEYIKSIQDLLVTMEKMVPGEAQRTPATEGKKTSDLDEAILREINEINFFMSVFIEPAEANSLQRVEGRVSRDYDRRTEGSTPCIAAGWPSWTGQMERENRRVCLFPMESRAQLTRPTREVCSNPSHRVCNPAIFGREKGTGANLCVPESNNATADCTKESSAGDIAKEFEEQLNDAKAKQTQAEKEKAWDQFRDSTVASIKQLQEICLATALQNEPSQIQKDQNETCKALAQRLAHLETYTCSNPKFEAAHEEICRGHGGVAGPTQPPCDGQIPSPTPGQRPGVCVESGEQRPVAEGGTCDRDIQRGWQSVVCDRSVSRFEQKQCQNSSGQSVTLYNCSTNTGRPESLNVGSDSENRPTRSNRQESSWSKWKPWLIFGGIMLAGYFLMDWAWKDATRAAVDRVPPTPQPPVTVPPPPPFGGIDGG